MFDQFEQKLNNLGWMQIMIDEEDDIETQGIVYKGEFYGLYLSNIGLLLHLEHKNIWFNFPSNNPTWEHFEEQTFHNVHLYAQDIIH